METVTLNDKEQKRLLVFSEVIAGHMTGQAAADVLGLSLRHTRRLLGDYRRRGAVALAHGNRGREPSNKLDATVEAEIVRLARGECHDYNDCHFAEELAERHEISLSRPTVRRVRREHGLRSPRKRRAPKHRQRRPRYRQPGMLLQVDGSKHDWLEGRGLWLTLHAAIDDASNEVPWAVFRQEEDATNYALLLHHISQTHGSPLALYADKHTIFQSLREATLEEQLQGLEPRTHLGRLLEELDVALIPAHSPQAKGRVERLFGTLQDRLVKVLRRAGATTLEEANAVLRDFLPRFNTRFMKAPAEAGSAYRPCLSLAEANARIHGPERHAFTYWRTVAKDHTISLFGQVLALPPLSSRKNLAGRIVALHHRMDGRLAIVYQDQVLALLQPLELGPPRLEQFVPTPQHLVARSTAPSTASPVVNGSATKQPRSYAKPAADHPWRHGYDQALVHKKQQQQQKET